MTPHQPTPFTRTARKDGRQVVTMRRFEHGDDFIIECDVYPVKSLRVEPVKRGPYIFGSKTEADAFLDETSRALEYLGCSLA